MTLATAELCSDLQW